MVPLRLKNSAQAADISGDMANNSASTYRSHSVGILSVCPFSHAVQFFTFMVPLNTAVDLKSLHSQFRRASLRRTLSLKALRLRRSVKMITAQVQFQIAKFKFRQYQNTTFFRHFAKFNARQIFPLYGSLFLHSMHSVCYYF